MITLLAHGLILVPFAPALSGLALIGAVALALAVL